MKFVSLILSFLMINSAYASNRDCKDVAKELFEITVKNVEVTYLSMIDSYNYYRNTRCGDLRSQVSHANSSIRLMVENYAAAVDDFDSDVRVIKASAPHCF